MAKKIILTPLGEGLQFYNDLEVQNTIVVANYSSLPVASSVPNSFYWVSNSQGTQWLPGTLGGTYYPKGHYYSNGTSWEYIETPFQATQSEVNTGTNTDKFVTPSTFSNASKWNLFVLLSGSYANPSWITSLIYSKITGGTSSQFVKADGSVDNTTYISGNQTITLSGDISGSGTTSITTAIGANKVTDSMIRQSSGNSVIGRSVSSSGNVADISGTSNTYLTVKSGTLSFSTPNVHSLFGNISTPFVVYRNVSGTGTGAYIFSELNSRLPFRYTSATGAGQEAMVLFEGNIPYDFSSFPSSCVSIDTRRSAAITTFNFKVYNSSGTLIVNESISPTNVNVFETKSFNFSGSWSPGDSFVVMIHYISPTNSSTYDFSRLKINYTPLV